MKNNLRLITLKPGTAKSNGSYVFQIETDGSHRVLFWFEFNLQTLTKLELDTFSTCSTFNLFWIDGGSMHSLVKGGHMLQLYLRWDDPIYIGPNMFRPGWFNHYNGEGWCLNKPTFVLFSDIFWNVHMDMGGGSTTNWLESKNVWSYMSVFVQEVIQKDLRQFISVGDTPTFGFCLSWSPFFWSRLEIRPTLLHVVAAKKSTCNLWHDSTHFQALRDFGDDCIVSKIFRFTEDCAGVGRQSLDVH